MPTLSSEASQAIDSLIVAVELKNAEQIRLSLSGIRKALSLSPEQFGEKVGVPGRSIRRWEKTTGRGPAAAHVRLWRRLLTEPGVGQAEAELPAVQSSAGVRRPAFFSSDDIVKRIRSAETVWAMRARLEFRANHSTDPRDVFLARLADPNDKFCLNCVWIKPSLLPDVRSSNQAKPSFTPKKSFKQMCGGLVIAAKATNIPAARLDARIKGLEVSLETAAACGFANNTIGHLILVYPDDSEFGTRVDSFIEYPPAWYDKSPRPKDTVEEFVWGQIHPPISSGYYEDVWVFDELESKAVVFNPTSIASWQND